MRKIKIDAYGLLDKIRASKPLVHHLTNWVTIYDCANIVKALGGSPVMAHARQEAAQMAAISSSVVLNIGTLTTDLVQSMVLAAKSANRKGIPVILDVCGAGATKLRDSQSLKILKEAKIDVIKGNSSEIARIAGETVKTKGVDSGSVVKDMFEISRRLSREKKCTVVVTGKEDIVTDGKKIYLVKNGDPLMTHVVGTGCMAASCIGAFCAVEKDLAFASASALVCFEVAAELAARQAKGPASFKERLFDSIFNLNRSTVNAMQKVEC